MRQDEASIVETIKLGFAIILKFSILTDILPVKLCMESNLKSTLKWKPSKRRVGRGYWIMGNELCHHPGHSTYITCRSTTTFRQTHIIKL